MTVYSQYNRLRRREFQLATIIEQVGDNRIVKKQALTVEARNHLRKIAANQKLLQAKLGTQGPVRLPRLLEETADLVSFEYIRGRSTDQALIDAFLTRDRDGFFAVIDRYQAVLRAFEGPAPAQFEPVFRNQVWLTPGIQDPNFDNVITSSEGAVFLIDNEWVSPEPVPAVLALHRALWVFYRYKYHEHALEAFVPWAELMERYGISSDLSKACQNYEEVFQRSVYGDNKAVRDRYRKPVLHIPGQVGLHPVDETLANIVAIKDQERETSLLLVTDGAAKERERLVRIKDEERERAVGRAVAESEWEAARLRDVVADLTARLERIENSGFWKMTAPLRSAKVFLTRCLRFAKKFLARGFRFALRGVRRLSWFRDSRLHWAVDSDLSLAAIGSGSAVAGWCFHESLAVVRVTIQFGREKTNPDFRKIRSDVQDAYPGRLTALYSGFETVWFPSRKGRLRVRLVVELENKEVRTILLAGKTRVVVREALLNEIRFEEAEDWVSEPLAVGADSNVRLELSNVAEARVLDAESKRTLVRLRLKSGSARLPRVVTRRAIQLVVSRRDGLARPEGRLWGTLERYQPPRNAPKALLPLLRVPPQTASRGPRAENVAIVVCVHNAFDDVKACLDSLLRSTEFPYSVQLVDDGSEEKTKALLESYSAGQGWALIRNDKARGYTFAANQGLRKAQGRHVVLLNSDTILPWGWLERLVACAESDPKIGIVSALSNTASWQSVPKIFDDGDWSQNPLPPGVSVDDMSRTVAQLSGRFYPRVGFLNGFCLLIKSEVIEKSGYFDEANFGAGYGEENDYCIRAQNLGWELAVADDAYVYHAQSKSYSSERRLVLARNAGDKLMRLHGQDTIDRLLAATKNNLVLESVRASIANVWEKQRISQQIRNRWEGRRVAFVLPSGGVGGGTNVVLHEARTLFRLGVDVRIINLREYKEGFERDYPAPGVPVFYADADRLEAEFSGMEYVVATANRSVEWLASLAPSQKRGYYIQDYEPDFYPEGSPDRRQALQSYTRFPDLRSFCKTVWNQKKLEAELGVSVPAIGISYWADLFRPRHSLTGKGLRDEVFLCAMIRPITPRRNPEFTMAALAEVSKRCGDRVRIFLFGCESSDPAFVRLPQNFPFENLGVLTNESMARMMNEQDVFADLSSFQAMGLTALEAMASGVAVVVPSNGGTTEFVTHGETGFVVDTASLEECVSRIVELVNSPDRRLAFQTASIQTTAGLLAERSIFAMMEALDA